MPKDSELSNKSIENYVNIQKNLMNEKRIRILLLLKKGASTWSVIMHQLDIRNPKLLHDHITTLNSLSLIEKDKDGFYHITKFGKLCLDSNISQINKILGLDLEKTK